MVKKNVFEYEKGWFHFELNWSVEENKPTIILKIWKIGLSINFFWVK